MLKTIGALEMECYVSRKVFPLKKKKGKVVLFFPYSVLYQVGFPGWVFNKATTMDSSIKNHDLYVNEECINKDECF